MFNFVVIDRAVQTSITTIITLFHFNNHNSFSVCTGLPKDWTGVKTETEFPVDTGTTITVSCQEGYINTGSSVVTCNTYLYQDFQYKIKPQCLLGKSKFGS